MPMNLNLEHRNVLKCCPYRSARKTYTLLITLNIEYLNAAYNAERKTLT